MAKRCIKFIPPNVRFDDEGWPVFSQPGQLRDYLAAAGKGAFHCIYSPAPMTDVEQHFEYVCRLARAAENLVLYIDEVDQMCSPNGMMAHRSRYWSLPENRKRIPAFSHLIDSGRHAGVALVMISRVPAQVNRKVTANCQEMRLFRQSEPNTVQYFADKIGRTASDQLPHLDDYCYLLWQDGKETITMGGRR